MFNIVPFRNDAIDKVTGDAKFSGDFYIEGMLHAKILWSPAPNIKIIHINTDKAEISQGVERIVTRKDITGPNLYNEIGIQELYDRPILIGEGEISRYVADALALVVAKSEDEAARALDLIEIVYEELPVVHTIEDAKNAGNLPFVVDKVIRGDVDSAFSKSHVIVEEKFFSPHCEHAYLEPEGGYAYIDHNGVINICVGTQDIRQQKKTACDALGIPYNKVELFSPFVGGSFGGKFVMSVHIYLALLVYVLKKPVRLVWTREESIGKSSKITSFKASLKMGLDKEGHILALQASVDKHCGAYYANGDETLSVFDRCVLGPYNIPNHHIVGKAYNTSALDLTAYRGLSTHDAIAAIESLLNKGAKELGIDQLTIRQRNWHSSNDEVKNQFDDCIEHNLSDKWTMKETMDAALKKAGELPKPATGKKVGRGIANARPVYAIGNSAFFMGADAHLELCYDKTLIIKLGFPEVGQGITGVATRLASNVLGILEKDMTVLLSDTHFSLAAGMLASSSATVIAGNAVLKAADNLKKLLCNEARNCLKCENEKIVFKNGEFYSNEGKIVLEWADFIPYCFEKVIPLVATGHVDGPFEGEAIGVTPVATIADVEVDEETGEINVLQIIHGHDVGKVINEPSLRGQFIGSTAQVLGFTLMEEFIMENGLPISTSFAEYLIPTTMDVPERVETVFLEDYPGHYCPEGAKGAGEHGVYCVKAAIVNAIYDATGVCINDFPITAEKMLHKLGKI